MQVAPEMSLSHLHHEVDSSDEGGEDSNLLFLVQSSCFRASSNQRRQPLPTSVTLDVACVACPVMLWTVLFKETVGGP